MARKNRTKSTPQRIKHNIEDRMARRALHRMVDESYRDEQHGTRYEPTGDRILIFTDPSFIVAGG